MDNTGRKKIFTNTPVFSGGGGRESSAVKATTGPSPALKTTTKGQLHVGGVVHVDAPGSLHEEEGARTVHFSPLPSPRPGDERTNPSDVPSLQVPVRVPTERNSSQPQQSERQCVAGSLSSSWKALAHATNSPVAGRGGYLARLSPTASVVAIAVNTRPAAEVSVLFLSLLTNTCISVNVYGESYRDKHGRYIRTCRCLCMLYLTFIYVRMYGLEHM